MFRRVEAKLYVIPASHPSRTATAMLDRKRIAYKRVDLMPVISKAALRAVGFPGITVPALKIDGRKVQGSREIARELERRVPEPALYPSDPAARSAVEAAERWGDETLQATARRILWAGMKRDRAPLASYSEGARLGVPIGLAVKTGGPLVALSARLNEASDENVRADLAALPGMLQRIDDWIADGVLGGEEPNAADLQIGASLRLLMTMDDVRPAIESRPAGALAMRAAPEYPGRMPPILPPAWLDSPLGLEAPGALDPLPFAEPLQRRAQPGAVGQRQLGVELEQRREHEPTARHLRVRQRQPLGLELELAEQQQVDVERARAVARAARPPATLGLDRLAGVEQRLGLERGLDPDCGVEEVGLVEDLAHRLGLIQDELAVTSTPRSASSSTAARRCPARSPTFEPRPR